MSTWPPGTHQDVQDAVDTVRAACLSAAAAGVATSNTGAANATAILALSAAHPGAKIFVPEGTYDFDRSLQLSGPLFGAGYGTVLRFPELATACLYWNGVNDLTVADLRIVSTSTNTGINTASSHGVLVDTCSRFSIRNLHISGLMVMGIHVRATQQGTIQGNTVTGTAADGIHLTNGCLDVSVIGNHTLGTGDDGIALISYNTDAAQNQRITVTGNTIQGAGSRGITVEGAKTVAVIANLIDGTTNQGVLVDSLTESTSDTWASVNVTVSDNVILSAGNDGMRLDGKVDSVSFRGNVIRSPGAAGIRGLKGSLVAVGNIIEDTAGDAGIILTADSTNVRALVADNMILRAFTYGIYSEASQSTIRGNVVIQPNQQGTGDKAAIQVFNVSSIALVANRVDPIDTAHSSVGIWLDTVTGALVAMNYVTGGATTFGSTNSTGILTS